MFKDLVKILRRDNLYEQALSEAHELLETDWTMFQASVRSLRQADDGTIDVDIYSRDKEINRGERDIRRKVLTHLSVAGPGNLSAGLMLVTVVIDIERIGDYTKNIYDLSRHHPKRLDAGSLEEPLNELETGVMELFERMNAAFRERDVDLARTVMDGYKKDLSAASESIVEAIVSGKADDLTSADAASVALYARYLKRIAAHSRNIISSVVNPFHRIGYREKKRNKPA